MPSVIDRRGNNTMNGMVTRRTAPLGRRSPTASVSASARSQLAAIWEEWLGPLAARNEALARENGELRAERDAAAGERDRLRAERDRDRRLADQLVGLRRRRCSARELTRVLGFRPGRLLIVVAGPSGGHCTKEVAALLPGR